MSTLYKYCRPFNNYYSSLKFMSLLFFFLSLMSCKKNWLDAKQDKSLVVPTTVQDFQAILDNTTQMNGGNPVLGEVSADNYYTPANVWQTLSTIIDKNAYIWATDIYQGTTVPDWNNPYKQVYYANVALKGLEKIAPDATNKPALNNAIGSALFYRAFAFYSLAQEFAPPFNTATANADMGIPLRLTADIHETSVRSSVEQTYSQILNDLIYASTLLPNTPLYKSRPSKAAAFALLARTYLVMEDYDKALIYADSCLQLYKTLLDYYMLNPNPLTSYPFPGISNAETIFYSTLANSNILQPAAPNYIIDSTLHRSYDSNDLRKSLFFRNVSGKITFRGSYNQSQILFGGLATDEIYLIRAECYARKGNTTAGLTDLNTLLQKRWANNGSFVPVTAINATDALTKILVERRKELIFRNLRWSDLRRLNKDSNFAVTLTRNINGQVYTLLPKDPKYVLPIPDNEIQLSGLQQNPR